MGEGVTTNQLVEAVAIGAVLMSLTDWLFFGILFHKQYFAYPEVWRPNTPWRVPVSAAIALLTPLAFVALVWMLRLADEHDIIHTAFLAWIMGPLPLIATNHFFFKLHPAITVTHIVGWLVKFLACAAGVIIAMAL